MLRVVIVGGGFGGLRVRGLRRAAAQVTLVDRRNFHLFQPLLYQVATGALSPGEIATPLRAVLKRQRDVRVLLAEAESVDLDRRVVHLHGGHELPYDALVLATGASHAYFGHDEWAADAPGLKSLEDALDLRSRILGAFESAELEEDPEGRRVWLTFVVVGGGPTGVEMAGQIAEIAHDTLRRNFRSIDPRSARILLFDAADHLLGAFPPRLQAKAREALVRLGVEVQLGRQVVALDEEGVTVEAHDGERERIPARTKVWAAGVSGSPLAAAAGRAAGAEVDRAGRVQVEPDLTLPGHPEVMVIGDAATLAGADGHPLPGVAPVAMQQGTYAARRIAARAGGGPEPGPFRYRDKGELATIGRAKAVADIKGLQLSGLAAWVTWLFVHLLYLVGFQNRLLVLLRWGFSFVTHSRGARLITGRR